MIALHRSTWNWVAIRRFSVDGHCFECARRLGGYSHYARQCAASNQMHSDGGESADLSLKMLITLALGLVLWLSYGVMRSDFIIASANGTSLCLVVVLLGFKWRDKKKPTDQFQAVKASGLKC
jgi:hypothetical protein